MIGIVEVKRKEDFSDKSVCQTIGYHVASHFVNACSSPKGDTIIPSLLVLICQDKLKFIFLPFMCEGHNCIDAIVTPSIPIFEGNLLISESWFSFICLYIVGGFEGDLKLMDANNYKELTLHVKKTYSQYMEILDVSKRLEELEEENLAQMQEISDLKKRLGEDVSH